MYKKKIFIVFEGIEGSGKSSHSLSLVKKLKSLKISSVYLREPGGSKEAECIRNFLLKNENKKFNSLTDTLLYLAARNENVLKKIKPLYKKKIMESLTINKSKYKYYKYKYLTPKNKTVEKISNYKIIGKTIKRKEITTSCIAIKSIIAKNILWPKRQAGDYKFINKVKKNYKINHFDTIIAKAQIDMNRSWGRRKNH